MVRSTDRPDIAIAVDWDIKNQTKQICASTDDFTTNCLREQSRLTHQRLPCSYTQNMDIDEDSDHNLDL